MRDVGTYLKPYLRLSYWNWFIGASSKATLYG